MTQRPYVVMCVWADDRIEECDARCASSTAAHMFVRDLVLNGGMRELLEENRCQYWLYYDSGKPNSITQLGQYILKGDYNVAFRLVYIPEVPK